MRLRYFTVWKKIGKDSYCIKIQNLIVLDSSEWYNMYISPLKRRRKYGEKQQKESAVLFRRIIHIAAGICRSGISRSGRERGGI